MEVISHLPPATSLDTMSSSDAQQFLKLEDLHTSSSPSASYDDSSAQTPNLMQTTPPPVIVHSRAAKKRKSWGQELPEPKTALPPRKRAKTDDEKEQRRIERIKRNRAAAHNSRERKRQETETLAVALARANAEIEAYRKLHGPLPASVVLPEISLCIDSDDTPAPSLIESHGTADAALSPASPADDLFDFDAPIKQEPTDYTLVFPPAFENLSGKPSSPLSALDPTQHSAAMLCDLQCRSSSNPRSTARPNSLLPYTPTWWSLIFLSLMSTQLSVCYKTMMLALWTASPSRMARMMQASTLRLTSPLTTLSTTPRRSRSMALAQLNAATGLMTRRLGAHAALLRQSMGDGRQSRSRSAGVESTQRVLSQRKASEDQGSSQDCDRRNSVADKNGGVPGVQRLG